MNGSDSMASSDDQTSGQMSDQRDESVPTGGPVEDLSTDDLSAEYDFEPAVSVTGADKPGSGSTADTAQSADTADTAQSADTVDTAERGNTVDTGDTPDASQTFAGLSRVRRKRSVRPAGKPGTKRSRSKLRHRVGASAVLLLALTGIGGAYAAFASSSGADDTGTSAQDVAAGRQLYQVSCITCHGANLQGVKGQGPALIGVGAAAVYFQVSTGRMPVAAQGAYINRKEAKFDDAQTDQLSAYVQSVGGGPGIPVGHLRGSDADIADGGALFRLNCASCHGTTFKGAPLSAGKVAPSLNASDDKQIYTAMLSGPESMPVFNDNQLTPDQKRAIIAYVQTLKASKDPGGSGIDRIGPVSEAIVIWTAGVGLLMVAILWIGARSR